MRRAAATGIALELPRLAHETRDLGACAHSIAFLASIAAAVWALVVRVRGRRRRRRELGENAAQVIRVEGARLVEKEDP